METILLGLQDSALVSFLRTFGPFVAVIITALITWFIASMKIRAQFDLKREETKLFIERSHVELKIRILKDLEELQSKFIEAPRDRYKSYDSSLASIRDRIQSYVEDEHLAKILQRGIEAVFELQKLPSIGDTLEEDTTANKKYVSTLYVVLRIAHERLSNNIGFKPLPDLKTVDDINGLAKDVLARSDKYV